MSLDALRGFDMFWILGADALVRSFELMDKNALTELLVGQLTHKAWDGFAFYDLIFPLFLFIAGVSTVFSLDKLVATQGRGVAVKRILQRTVLLVVVGIFYSGGVTEKWPDIRLLGVLQRIGLAYGAAALLYVFLKPRALLGALAGLLVGYWALMTFVPVRDIQLEKANLARLAAETGVKDPRALFLATTNRVTGVYDAGRNVANHFDFEHLPGKKYNTYWDPEGLLSTFPAVATALLGIFAGLWLRRAEVAAMSKVAWLFGGGVVLVGVGFLWGLQFPVVKKIWTSSFVLVAGGWSAMLLGAFYLVVDVWQWQRWAQPFVWIGMNPITLYLASNLLGGFRKVAARLAGGDVKVFFDTALGTGFGDFVLALVGLTLMLLFARFLYQRKIFLRL
jgi:predicted acyltransferase